MYKFIGIDKISAEMVQAGWETLRYEIHELVNEMRDCEVRRCVSEPASCRGVACDM
jgi:hypothetical protein